MLQRNHPEVNVVGVAMDVPTGIELIRTHIAAGGFPDIELKDKTGFDILKSIGRDRPRSSPRA
ncbi:MAG: hypothetical protein IPL64_02790 [Flavobacteriales bacterium]|nr:hypothetical protein [Flavobacteriales bacterium]